MEMTDWILLAWNASEWSIDENLKDDKYFSTIVVKDLYDEQNSKFSVEINFLNSFICMCVSDGSYY
jgi:hypothetical protein